MNTELTQYDLHAEQPSQKPKECWSVDGEDFSYDTLDELMSYEHDDLSAGMVIHVAEAITPDPADYIDVDAILNQMGEQAADDCGEYAEDYPDVDDAAKQELEDFLKAWARKHCAPTNFYKVQNVREYNLTAEDLE